jgi:uracil-DNA glycosylase
MSVTELKQSVREYQRVWEELGVELGPQWLRAPGFLARGNRPAAAAVAEPPAPSTLEEVRAWLGECTRCKLGSGRTKIVFGSGNPKARLLFLGDGPGAEEDTSGNPFVGQAGELLTKIIEAMGFDRERDTYVANLVKCRPPGDRAPEPDETAECSPFLKAQIRLVGPEVIVALGSAAAAALLPASSTRGKFQPLSWAPDISVLPTLHPAHLLQNASAKKAVWEDMKLVVQKLGGRLK